LIWRPLDIVLLILLFPAAALVPLPLYLVALSLFGLPHVLWELRWLQLAGQGVFSPRLVLALAACLGVLVLGRAGVLLNLPWASWAPWLDALALVLALLVVLPRVPRPRRSLALLLMAGLGVCLVLRSLELLIALLMLLSVAHNLTPLALLRWRVPASSSMHVHWRVLFCLPVLLLLLGGLGVSQSLVPLGDTLPGEAAWLVRQGVADHWLHGAMSALVMLQCLHYLAVLRWLPRTLPKSLPSRLPVVTDKQHNASDASPLAWSGTALWRAAVLSSVIMTLCFAVDFQESRLLYAVAAGVHAWLEWPLLLAYREANQAEGVS